MTTPTKPNKATDALLGLATGDALGVPYEFKSRSDMAANPATGMIGYGTHVQPPGTWSDDSSLTFCLADSLQNGYDLRDMADQFVRWLRAAHWTARGQVFDIGNTTHVAIRNLEELLKEIGDEPLKELTAIENEYENGNGSLMRILPLLFYIKDMPIAEQYVHIHEVSALTHRHSRAAMSCLIYLKLAENLLEGKEKLQAYSDMRNEVNAFWDSLSWWPAEERRRFDKIMAQDLLDVDVDQLSGSGYVLPTLEAALYFFLRENNYSDTVLGLINLGFDTDTTATVGGGLAGLYYGAAGIPEKWLEQLARRQDIETLGEELAEKYL